MTIAASYFSSEGVVFGADSTSTAVKPGNQIARHYDYAQKIFEVGSDGTLGIVTWGLGSFGATSHRTLVATLSNELFKNPVGSVSEAADRLAHLAWSLYSTVYAKEIVKVQAMNPIQRKAIEPQLRLHSLGYCIGGTWDTNITPQAYEIIIDLSMTSPPKPSALKAGIATFWGVQNMMERLINGIDPRLKSDILQSGRWKGTPQELDALIANIKYTQPAELPLRDAIDWVHTAILTTIKTLKFSQHPVVCGGPVEIAVVTSDRPFRWVTHKRLDDAITGVV